MRSPDAWHPWASAFGFRLNAPPQRRVRVQSGSRIYEVELDFAERDLPAWVEPLDDGALVGANDGLVFAFQLPSPRGAAAGGEGDGALISPMPGKIIAVEVRQGDVVAKGQKLLTLEAMKMEHSLVAPFDGVVAELSAVTGGQVSEGTLLARIEKGEG
jgi:3-methylcrotonyl-CoA carboxylase alpha subunit